MRLKIIEALYLIIILLSTIIIIESLFEACKMVIFEFVYDYYRFLVVILIILLIIIYYMFFNQREFVPIVLPDVKIYLTVALPVVSVNTALLLNLLATNYSIDICLMLVISFLIIMVASNQQWFNKEISKHFSILAYIIMRGFDPGIFCQKIIVVLLAMFWFGVAYRNILEKSMPRLVLRIAKSNVLIIFHKILYHVFSTQEFNVFTRFLFYSFIVTTPLYVSYYAGFVVVGIIYVTILLHFNMFLMSCYNTLILKPSVLRNVLCTYEEEDRRELLVYLIGVANYEEELRREFTMYIIAMHLDYFKEKDLEKAKDVFLKDYLILCEGYHLVMIPANVNGVLGYGPGIFGFCYGFFL